MSETAAVAGCGTLNVVLVFESWKATKSSFAAFGLIISASSVVLMTGNSSLSACL